jgi:hypothetical protein
MVIHTTNNCLLKMLRPIRFITSLPTKSTRPVLGIRVQYSIVLNGSIRYDDNPPDPICGADKWQTGFSHLRSAMADTSAHKSAFDYYQTIE